MATVDVLDLDKKKVGTVELNKEVFEAPVRKDLLYTVVRWQLSKRRQGTHKAKTRGEVSGGGKKPYKQKGTGNARRGSSRSPLIAGGGVTFGPSPRSYDFALTKKMKQAGLRSALSYLLKEGKLLIVDKLTSSDGKTNAMSRRLSGLGAKKAVLVSKSVDEMVARSTRNARNYLYYSPAAVNVYDLLKFDMAVISKDSLETLNKKCGVEAN